MFQSSDYALYAISIIGVFLVLQLSKKDFRFKKALLYGIFIIAGVAAAFAASYLNHADSLGALVTRSMLFQAFTIYFLSGNRPEVVK